MENLNEIQQEVLLSLLDGTEIDVYISETVDGCSDVVITNSDNTIDYMCLEEDGSYSFYEYN